MAKNRKPKHKYGNMCNLVIHLDAPKPPPIPYATVQKLKEKQQLTLGDRAAINFSNKQKSIAGIYINPLRFINTRGMVSRVNGYYQHAALIKKWK